jgi:hypothetical protein
VLLAGVILQAIFAGVPAFATSPEKDFFLYIYDVITSPEKEKSSANYC